MTNILKKVKVFSAVLVISILAYANFSLIEDLVSRQNNEAELDIKDVVIPDSEEISQFVEKVFEHKSLQIYQDEIDTRKNVVIRRDSSIVGYTYTVAEEILCPLCSDVNYLMILDKNYIVKDIIFLRKIIENHEIVSDEVFRNSFSSLIDTQISEFDFSKIVTIPHAEKHSKKFIESLRKIKKNLLFYK